MKTALVLFLILSTLKASDINGSIVKDLTNANINAILVFNSNDTLSTGRFNFKNINANMNFYGVPFIFQLDDFSDNVNIFFKGSAAYADMREDVSSGIVPDNAAIVSYFGSLGSGIRVHNSYGFSMLFGFELIYSRMKLDVIDYDGIDPGIIEKFFSSFNENLTYKIGLNFMYEKKFKYVKPYASLSFYRYDTKSAFSFNDIFNFTNQSNSFKMRFGAESSPYFSYKKFDFTVEGYGEYDIISGSASQILNVNDFYLIGSTFYAYTSDYLFGISRIYLDFSKLKGSGVEGVNIGFGVTLHF